MRYYTKKRYRKSKKGNTMTTISMSEIRLKLSELANRVIYGGERVVGEKNNKPAFAMVSMEDMELLERLEEEIDIKAAEEALKEGDFIPLDDLVKELGIEEGETDKDV
ncbi:MAG: type II toxin-antitoxin system prevent-host-death family antitoxin [Planctomycetota bacterium]